MNQKKQTKRSAIFPKDNDAIYKEITTDIEDVLALNDGQAMAIEKDMYDYVIKNKATKSELLQYICSKLNKEKEWRAWAAILMFKRVAK